VQEARILLGQRREMIDAEQLEHVGEDRADALDPGEVGTAIKRGQDLVLDRASAGEPTALPGAACCPQ
jgi:hypothetical protein